MADDTSNLINIDRLETFDTNLKNYIDTNSQASELLDEVILLIEDNIASGKAAIAQSVTNKGVPTTADQGYSEIAANIDSIKTGSGTATADKVLAGETFTNSTGEELTGTIPSKAAATYTPGTANQTIAAGQYLSGAQTIAGDADLTAANIRSGANIFNVAGSFTGNATATAASILSGATAGVKGAMVTGTIPSLAATSYTPGASDKTIASGQYLSGVQTIKGDTNLAAGNIKTGTSIFGVTGTYTSDATATAAQILTGQTAYVNGTKITGTIPSLAATTYTPGTANQTIAAGQYLSGAQTIAGSSNLVAGNIKSGVKIFNVTGSLTISSMGGTEMKSVTKTYSDVGSGGTVSGLTQAQLAGLYSVYVDGTIVGSGSNGSTATVNGYGYIGAASDGSQNNTGWRVYGDTGGNYFIYFKPTDAKLSTYSASYKFTGSITWYYFE